MAKWANDLFMDAALDWILNNVNKMTACQGQPTTFTEGNATNALADVAMTSGDFTKANGDTSGRKLTVGAKNDVLIDASGNADHVALLDTVNSILAYVTTCTTQALVGGSNVSFPAWDIEIGDPA